MTQAALIIQQPNGPARQLVLLFHGLGADEANLTGTDAIVDPWLG